MEVSERPPYQLRALGRDVAPRRPRPARRAGPTSGKERSEFYPANTATLLAPLIRQLSLRVRASGRRRRRVLSQRQRDALGVP